MGPPQVKKPLCVPHFLSVENNFSLPDLPSVPKSRLKELMIRTIESQAHSSS